MAPLSRLPRQPGSLDVPPANHPLLFIAAVTHPYFVCCAVDPPAAEDEIQRIIDSIRFDGPEAQDALESKPDRTQPGWATTTTASPGPDPTGLVDAPNGGRTFGPERHSVSVEGVPLSFETPTCVGFWTADGYCIHEGRRVEGWEPFGSLLLSKNFVGPQDAEALIFWSRWPSGSYAQNCLANTLDSDGEQAPLEVANRISRAPGVEVVRDPIAASVGGRSAQYVVVTVTEDKGCDPGYFYQWTPRQGGAFWTRSELGDTIEVWVVDMEGLMQRSSDRPQYPALLVIAAETRRDAPSVAKDEIQQIIDSIRFDE